MEKTLVHAATQGFSDVQATPPLNTATEGPPLLVVEKLFGRYGISPDFPYETGQKLGKLL